MMSPNSNTPLNKIRDDRQKNRAKRFSVLPVNITPPSGLTKFIARNPFEADLTSKLHISVISPNVFKKGSTPTQNSPGFSWSVEELAHMQPAKIDEYPIQQMHCSDPEIEKTAQEAISRFFSENQIIPSPLEPTKSQIIDRLRASPFFNRGSDSVVKTPVVNRETKECWTQTTLSLPPQLPSEVEEVLKPYFNFNGNNCDAEESISSNNSSLRRKLFANNSDESDDDDSVASLSPFRKNTSVLQNVSPPQSGMFFHGTPLQNCSRKMQRTYGSPLNYKGEMPCEVSPIANPVENMSYQSIRSSNRSVVKLDFTKDMSIDESFQEIKECDENSKNDIIGQTINFNTKNSIIENTEITQMMVSSDISEQFGQNNKENIESNLNIDEKSKLIDFSKRKSRENYVMQQSKMISGNYIHNSVNSGQDTGYSTLSGTSNGINSMDSYSTSLKHKPNCQENMVAIDEEVQLLEWKNHMMNMISSTPSKFLVERKNC